MEDSIGGFSRSRTLSHEFWRKSKRSFETQKSTTQNSGFCKWYDEMQLISGKRPGGRGYQSGSLADLPKPASKFLYTDVRSSQPIRGDMARRPVSAYIPGFTADRGSASEGPRQAPPLTTSHCQRWQCCSNACVADGRPSKIGSVLASSATQHDRSEVRARCTNLLEPRQGTEEGLDVGF